MNKTKIKSLTIKGLRGVQGDVALSTDTKSSLLYGDNGSGKSGLSDAIEWFLFDKIDHLTGEEIGRKGNEALRNVFLSDDDEAFISIEFNNSQFNNTKQIENKSGILKSSFIANSSDFDDFIAKVRNENVILRYTDLIKFVLSSKTDKLKNLSEIIGYAKVTQTKETLGSTYRKIASEIRSQGFENLISSYQSQILEQFSENIVTDDQFIKKVIDLITPLDLKINVIALKDVNDVLKKLKELGNIKDSKKELFFQEMQESLATLPSNIDEIERLYKDYEPKFNELVSNSEKLKKLTYERLLSSADNLVSGKDHLDDSCPLCLQEIKKEELSQIIKKGLGEVELVKQEKRKIEEDRSILADRLRELQQKLISLLNKEQMKLEANKALEASVQRIKASTIEIINQINIKTSDKTKIKSHEQILYDRENLSDSINICSSALKEIKDAKNKLPIDEIYSKIHFASKAYAEIRKIKKTKALYENQRDNLEKIYKIFLGVQKESLQNFLDIFSQKINDIYQFLNPGEKVENIKLVTIEKDEELQGITVQFDFLENKDVYPPQKYLSESHLNCIGIAFFFTSVIAFNKTSGFIILDDVISSFDAAHRKRFADLLVEQYSDYQIIALTHEETWFNIFKNLVKSKWIVKSIKYNRDQGTYIDEDPQVLKNKIIKKVQDKNDDGLGNDARKYLEEILKAIALNLEVKLVFRTNDSNEDRMAHELLTELKSTLKKRKCTELITEPNSTLIDRLLGSVFIANKDSHHNGLNLKFDDMKAFWDDVQAFEKLFFCEDCQSDLCLKFYDKATKQVKCKSGHLTYSWQD